MLCLEASKGWHAALCSDDSEPLQPDSSYPLGYLERVKAHQPRGARRSSACVCHSLHPRESQVSQGPPASRGKAQQRMRVLRTRGLQKLCTVLADLAHECLEKHTGKPTLHMHTQEGTVDGHPLLPAT